MKIIFHTIACFNNVLLISAERHAYMSFSLRPKALPGTNATPAFSRRLNVKLHEFSCGTRIFGKTKYELSGT